MFDDDSWDVLAPFQELAKECLRSLRIASALYQDVQDRPVLIYRPPEIVALALDRQKHLIQVPFVAWLRTSAPQLIGIGLPELPAPLADGLICDDDSTGKQHFFHIAVAQAKTEVQPDTMADDLGRETVVLVAVGEYWCVHPPSISHPTTAQQVDNVPRRKTMTFIGVGRHCCVHAASMPHGTGAAHKRQLS
jgi:hypothetical protein